MIDHTHDPQARSWVASANGHRDFPIQNLPLGVFRIDGSQPRCGVAIGDMVLDLAVCSANDLLPRELAGAVGGPTLNGLLALGAPARRALRHAVFELLADRWNAPQPVLHRASHCEMLLPAAIGGYTDFYAGILHATNVGRILRPDNPLLPNYRHVPIGYHGRTSTIRPSGAEVRRPCGQVRDGDADPALRPSTRLDYELELGLWIADGNRPGEPISIAQAGRHIAGVSLLNDWSARDVQAWEYVPLGPFLAKNFATTIAPWIITSEALEPFRTAQPPRPPGDPAPLAYLSDPADQAGGALAVELEVGLLTPAMRRAGLVPHPIGRARATDLYWTPAQLVAHHTVNGCNLEPGDLLGTGTISSPGREGFGSLMEMTAGGREPLALPNGEARHFLEDGDEVVMTGRCVREGFRTIGLGECRGTITPARTEGIG